MAAHNDLGRWGERLAADYLSGKGWKIVEQDWRNKHNDIDLICLDAKENVIVFVEVKTRSTAKWGEPYEAITPQKKQNIISAATAFLHDYKLFDKPWRYDSISIVGTPDTSHKLEHNTNIIDILDSFYCNNKKKLQKKNNSTWGTMRWGRGY